MKNLVLKKFTSQELVLKVPQRSLQTLTILNFTNKLTAIPCNDIIACWIIRCLLFHLSRFSQRQAYGQLYDMRLLILVVFLRDETTFFSWFFDCHTCNKKDWTKKEDFGISRDENGFLNSQNCSRRFFLQKLDLKTIQLMNTGVMQRHR